MSRYAKDYFLDIPHYSAVEFPLIVNDIDKAIDLIGGEKALIKATQDHEKNPLELRFSKNKYEHPIASTVSSNENIIIKISVPTKEYEANGKNIRKTLAHLQKLEIKPKSISIQPIGIINKTFRFREISDFQYQTGKDEFTIKTNNAVHNLNYHELKENFIFEQDLEPTKIDSNSFNFPPPPRFSSVPLPFDYRYTKNMNSVEKEGKYEVRNRPFRLNASILKYDDPIPLKPPMAVTEKLEFYLQNFTRNTTIRDTLKVIDILKTLFEKRPIWIRKHLEAIIPIHLRYTTKYALPHVAFTYVDGPWRQNYVKFGINPKSSHIYARYQLGAFRVNGYRNPKNLQTFITDNESDVASAFKFNGIDPPISLLFQIEQLTDPEVEDIVAQVKYKEEPNFDDGWFDKLTLDKIRLVVPFKLKSIVKGEDYDRNRLNVLLERLESNYTNGLMTQSEEEEEDQQERPDDIESEEEEEDDDDEFYDQTLLADEKHSHELDKQVESLNVQEANFEEILAYLTIQHPEAATELKGMINGIAKLGQMDL